MPSVELKTGEYTIPANTTKEFTFWWGSNALPAEYFDVSIELNPKIFNMTPLIEERREVTMFNGAPPKEEEIDELFGLKMGADDFTRKPFSHRLLVERIKVLLRRADSR